MNGEIRIDCDGAGLGQYRLRTDKASCSWEYTPQYYRMPKKMIAKEVKTYHTTEAATNKKR